MLLLRKSSGKSRQCSWEANLLVERDDFRMLLATCSAHDLLMSLDEGTLKSLAYVEVVLEIIVRGSDIGNPFELHRDEHPKLLCELWQRGV